MKITLTVLERLHQISQLVKFESYVLKTKYIATQVHGGDGVTGVGGVEGVCATSFQTEMLMCL